ncbi:MAG TPA: hypothetical protein VD763_14235 [Candidatus Saccharimonadales bacterium]|nr:hypothetical protein [Candidatus Saccharimonadales bacterium]
MSGRGAVAGGLILVLLGVFFLARNVIPGFDPSQLIPLGSVVLGVVLIVLSVRPARPGA